MFNTRNKSGISAHPCIILYIYSNIALLAQSKPVNIYVLYLNACVVAESELNYCMKCLVIDEIILSSDVGNKFFN